MAFDEIELLPYFYILSFLSMMAVFVVLQQVCSHAGFCPSQLGPNETIWQILSYFQQGYVLSVVCQHSVIFWYPLPKHM